MFDLVIHRLLQIPYPLNIRYLRRVKRPRATLLFIHGLGDTGDMWQRVIKSLPDDVTVIAIDLLGFGDSPKPLWSKYNAPAQARSLLSTYLTLGIRTKVIVVGHSLGSLVAIEFAKRYPLLTESLVLCSPPIYRQTQESRLYRRSDDVLRLLYSRAANDPDGLIKLYAFAKKIGVGNESLAVNDENIQTFIATLRASIINQSTINDIAKLSFPIHIIHGLLDPFIIRTNLVRLAKSQPNITLHEVPAAHIIRGPFTKKVVNVVRQLIDN